MIHNRNRRVAIYARVSTSNQTVENQLQELRVVAERNQWNVVIELSDNGISGTKGRDQRPAFDDLLKRATRREFDLIMVWAIDRGDVPLDVEKCEAGVTGFQPMQLSLF